MSEKISIPHFKRIVQELESRMVAESGSALANKSVGMFASRLNEVLDLPGNCLDGQCLDAGRCRIAGFCVQYGSRRDG